MKLSDLERKQYTSDRLKRAILDARKVWLSELDERQQREVEFAETYARIYKHGTEGHNRLMLIAKMSALLDEIILYLP